MMRASMPLQLKSALADVLEAEGAVKPKRVRFFRGQMQTIISRALGELDIKPVPSRRCFALIGAHAALLCLFCARQQPGLAPASPALLLQLSTGHEHGSQLLCST